MALVYGLCIVLSVPDVPSGVTTSGCPPLAPETPSEGPLHTNLLPPGTTSIVSPGSHSVKQQSLHHHLPSVC